MNELCVVRGRFTEGGNVSSVYAARSVSCQMRKQDITDANDELSNS